LINFLHPGVIWGNAGLSALINLIIVLAVVAFSTWVVDRRRFDDLGFHIDMTWWKDVSFGMALGAVLMGLIFGVEWLAGWISIDGFMKAYSLSSALPSGNFFWYQFLAGLLSYICIGISEEILFRGYAYKNLAEWFSHPALKLQTARFLAAILSSAIFGLLHLANPNASWISSLNIFFAGMLLSLGVLFTGELAISIGLHFAWNFFQGVVFGFPVSGITSPANLIVNHETGPDKFTGGLFGPEAGILGLAAMLMGGTAIYWYSRKKHLFGK
jgi:membrane protease YdiL (CAAX protease family)